MRFATSALLLLSPLAVAAAAVGFAPPTQTAGGTASVNVVIDGLFDLEAPSLGDYDLLIDFNPAILAVVGVTFGDPVLGNQLDLFGFGSLNEWQLPAPGQVRLTELSLDDPADLDLLQAGSFVLATISFNVHLPGTGLLLITINSLGDSVGAPLDADTTTGSITAVPEPASLLLLGSGLIGLAGLLRARSSRKR